MDDAAPNPPRISLIQAPLCVRTASFGAAPGGVTAGDSLYKTAVERFDALDAGWVRALQSQLRTGP